MGDSGRDGVRAGSQSAGLGNHDTLAFLAGWGVLPNDGHCMAARLQMRRGRRGLGVMTSLSGTKRLLWRARVAVHGSPLRQDMEFGTGGGRLDVRERVPVSGLNALSLGNTEVARA